MFGLGDAGKPINLEWRLPRSEPVTVTFNPLLAAMVEAFDVLAVGVSGSWIRMPGSLCEGLDDDADSTVTSPS